MADLTFEQAATVGVSAQTALQALRDHGKVQAGQKVLVNGASGGVGTFAVQIAKAFGAEVTGVCSTRDMDITAEDFTQGGERCDFILDQVGNHSMSDTRRALTPSGTLLSNGAPVRGRIGGLDHVIKAFVVSLFVRQQLRPFVSLNNMEVLATLKELTEAGKVTPVIDETFPLSETPQAMAHVAEGHSQGKTVITV